MPLLHFEKKWRRAPKKESGKLVRRKAKTREIRYPCRKDSYIFKYYRELLSVRYEAELAANGISDCVIAYRHIPKRPGSESCKSNIEFARDAFEVVKEIGNCCAVAIDVSDFFGSMSHNRIKDTWANLLGVDHLPDDHFSVFTALTKYRYVDRDDAYVALGYSGYDADKKIRYLVKPDDIPVQICSNKQFREKIVGGKLVKKNNADHGIPQGCPLSDLIANSYLKEFDIELAKYARSKGGRYFRYSDDILFILPGDGRAALAAFKKASNEIKKMGPNLIIKAEKTEITIFKQNDGVLAPVSFTVDADTQKSTRKRSSDGMSYLGFRFDGQGVYLRNSTIANVAGKMFRTCQAVALNHVDRYLDKDIAWLLDNSPIDEVAERFFQVKDFEEAISVARTAGRDPYRKMTFFSYAKRAADEFQPNGKQIERQTAKLKKQLEGMLNRQIVARYQTRDTRLALKRAERTLKTVPKVTTS